MSALLEYRWKEGFALLPPSLSPFTPNYFVSVTVATNGERAAGCARGVVGLVAEAQFRVLIREFLVCKGVFLENDFAGAGKTAPVDAPLPSSYFCIYIEFI